MYIFKKVRKTDFHCLTQVAAILNACGKDMAQRYDLHHWDNSYLKSIVIVMLCSFRNEIYLLFEEDSPVATFMTHEKGKILHFEKLGTNPFRSGRGIGSRCMAKIEEIAKTKGCKSVSMEVYDHSHHAISFYEHKGYQVVGKTGTLKYKEVIMEKSI